MFGSLIAALLICQNCRGAPLETGELNEKQLVEELQSQEGIVSLRAFKESASRGDLESTWLAQLAEDMSRDSMSSNYNQKFDLLYENHTDLNKALKFDSIKLNCGKDFNIFRLLEQVKAHRNPVTEGTPKCVECLLEDATCTTTVPCPTTPPCTTTPCVISTTCGSAKTSNGAARKSTPKVKLNKKPEPLRHTQDFQHSKPEQIVKQMSRQENPLNSTYGRRIQEGLGLKPTYQHFDKFPEKLDRFSQRKTAQVPKLVTNNAQVAGLTNINPSPVNKQNFIELRKTEQNFKESRIEGQNALPSKTGEQNIALMKMDQNAALYNTDIQSSVTSKIEQNTVASKTGTQNSLLLNVGEQKVGITNAGTQDKIPSQLNNHNVLIPKPGLQNSFELNVGGQNAIAPTQESEIVAANNLVAQNSMVSQSGIQTAQSPKAEIQISVAPKTSEKNVVVVSMAVAHNLATSQDSLHKDGINNQRPIEFNACIKNSLESKPEIQNSLASASGQKALSFKEDVENSLGFKDHGEIISKTEDQNAMPQIGAINGIVSKPEDLNMVAPRSGDTNDLGMKANDQSSIEFKADYNAILPMGDQNVISNKVGDLNGEMQQLGDQNIVDSISEEQSLLGYKIGDHNIVANKPDHNVILPKGGDQNDIAHKAGELFGVVPPNLETQNIIAPQAANIISPKSDQNIFGNKLENQNVGLKELNAIAPKSEKLNTMASNLRVQNAGLHTKELNFIVPKTDNLNVIPPIIDDQNAELYAKEANVILPKIDQITALQAKENVLPKIDQNVVASQSGNQQIVETIINEATQRIPLIQDLYEPQEDQNDIDTDLNRGKQQYMAPLKGLMLDKKLLSADSSIGLTNNRHAFDYLFSK